MEVLKILKNNAVALDKLQLEELQRNCPFDVPDGTALTEPTDGDADTAHDDSDPTIHIGDMVPTEDAFVVVPELTPCDWSFCSPCTGLFPPEKFQQHVALGPFAEGHPLGHTTDKEIQMLVTLNTYSFAGNKIQCNYCPTAYSFLNYDPDIHKHSLTHAEHLLSPLSNLVSAKQKLFRKLCNNEDFETAVCLPCNRLFKSPQLFFLHLTLTDHAVDKHYCLICKICLTQDIQEHFRLRHPKMTRCPFYHCGEKTNQLSHHIKLRHPQAHNLVPHPEMKKIRNSNNEFHENSLISGRFGSIKFDRNLTQTINSICQTPPVGTNIADVFDDNDTLAWRISKSIINSRIERRQISEIYYPHIKRNPMRFLSRILLLDRQMYAETKREENPILAFTAAQEKPKNMAFLSEIKFRYTSDFLRVFDIILLGNCHFKTLTSSKDLKMLNLSTVTDSVWNFDSLGVRTSDMNFEFTDFVTEQVRNMANDCKQTIYLESSLQPFLQNVPY